jgi:hypothetical protein
VIVSQIIYNRGIPEGFFFAKNNHASDLAACGKKYVFSKANKGESSHEVVELNKEQWELVEQIFFKIGAATLYHGMIDIEFIVGQDDIFLLECNPRFSGAIHASTISNPSFMNHYLNVVLKDQQEEGSQEECINFSNGVEMKTRFSDFNPAGFYAKRPLAILALRDWTRTACSYQWEGKRIRSLKRVYPQVTPNATYVNVNKN